MAGRKTQDDVRREGRDSYSHRGATTTVASSTLFISNVPMGCPLSDIDALLQPISGFNNLRTARGLYFADFRSVREATGAMIRLQGAKLRAGRDGKGLVVDYDKDTGKNTREQTRVDTSALQTQAHENALRVYCAACGTKGLELINVKEFPGKLKTRRTDGSLVVKQAKHVLTMRLSRGEEKFLQRDGGMERQHRLNCTRCDMALAYRPVAATETCDFLYIFEGAMRESYGDKRRKEAASAAAASEQAASTAAAAAAAGAAAVEAAADDDVALLLGRDDDDEFSLAPSKGNGLLPLPVAEPSAKRQRTEEAGVPSNNKEPSEQQLTTEQILRQSLLAKKKSAAQH